ncbi:hypothetical protein SH668x_002522 [Planctomicrobium sp. SH668]|uniref:hypothetical protein n=1 Tax=Planctomicrobium sp. SH668 TaxID=3448126 RepID=UPI003F5BA49E
MAIAEIKKQVSIFLPVSQWRTLRSEAARLGMPVTELCRQWIIPEIGKLPNITEIRQG